MKSLVKTAQATLEQPWFVLNAMEGFTQFNYESKSIAQIYRFRAGGREESTFAIPDGCVDILFDCSGSTPFASICGSTLFAKDAQLKSGHHYVGIRFTPGNLPKYLNLTPKDLINQCISMDELVHDKHHLLDKLVFCDNFLGQIHILQQHFEKEVFIKPSNKSLAALNTISTHSGNIQLTQLEALTGVSKRSLQRIFRNEFGLSPKEFSRIIRCQKAIKRLNETENNSLSDLTHLLGFSDQAHFLREFKTFVNATPYKYKKIISKSPYLEQIIDIAQ